MDTRALGRFLSKVDGDPDTGCWDWTGSLTHDGYGHFWLDGRMRRAHRVAYEHCVGVMPDGCASDQLCRNRACVFYQHLEAVPQRTNILRGVGPTAQNATATACKNGHPFAEETTRLNRRGSRVCIPCERASMADYSQRNRAALLTRASKRRVEEEQGAAF